MRVQHRSIAEPPVPGRAITHLDTYFADSFDV